MLNVVAGAMLAFACAYIGLGIKRAYGKKHDVFLTAYDFCCYAIREIGHLKTPQSALIADFTAGNKGIFPDTLKRFSEKQAFGFSTAGEVLQLTKTRYLSASDNLLIADFLFGFGKGDLQTEMTNLQRFQGVFDEKTRKYELDCKKNGEMYYKLFVLLGVALMIIVV